MTIVEAVKALAEGKKIRRNDWSKGDYVTLKDNKVVSQSGLSSGVCIEDLSADWWEEYIESPLDDKEKEYLGNVLIPFRDIVKYVDKLETYWVDNGEFIFISLGDDINEHISLPWFPKGSMYKGMETGKKYTLKELGL